ncbi:hypothetical protein CBR_g39809 [Chara braunii]|uniref:STAS domain-containing protein n=1 Tax=Chara braunii TaxID=69332 RepID=A0A388LSN8_CHABU|nr:hypothetical protein CBR_g39809 [Chara braunii]|eukprot:GBG85243.1 hypothetical protein CBR_g39809 [Chara braunii]
MAVEYDVREDSAECKVAIPPKRAILDDAMSILPVTAARDPFKDFRGKRRREQIKLLIYSIFPIVEWIQRYSWKLFRDDLIAGLTIASLAVPQDLAYAKLAHLPSKYGLYSSLVPPYVYSVFGTSRQLAIGPVAVVSLLLGELLTKEFKPYLDNKGIPTDVAKFEKQWNPQYVYFAFLATFFTGLIQLSLGIFRLGFLIEYMSHSVVVGFMGGAAVTIAGSQLKGLIGYKDYTTKSNIQSIVNSIIDHTDQFKWETFVLGMVFLTYLLIAKFMAKKNKKFFYFAATGPLVSVVLSAAFIKVTGIKRYRVKTVGNFPSGLPPSSFEHFDWGLTGRALKVAAIAAFVALTIDIAAMKQIWQTDKLDFVALLGAFFGVVFISVEVRELIVESLEQAKKTDNEQAPVEFVVLEMSPVVDIDVTGIVALEDLKATLKNWNIQLALANPNQTVLGKLNQSKFIEKLGTEWLFVSAAEAERTVSRLVKGPSAMNAAASEKKGSSLA